MKPLTAEWVEKAEGDFVTARRERYARNSPNYDAVCFHTQQMAEKYIKAFLQEHEVAIPRTHDLVDLLNICLRFEPNFIDIETHIKSLNGYAIGVRYPGQTIYKDEAVDALHHAMIVRKFFREKFNLTTD